MDPTPSATRRDTVAIAAVLFDMDGVLIDTDAAIAGLWRGLAADNGVPLDDAGIAAHVYGCAPEHTVATVFAALPPAHRDDVLARVRAAEPDLGFTPLPGAAALVDRLATAGVPLALVTGGSAGRARRVLDGLGVTGRFAAAVTWGEAAHGKPAPDCYLLAARRLDVAPGACLVFEDTPSGVRSAVAAGARCVGVTRTVPAALRDNGAAHVVPGLTAIAAADAPDGVALTATGIPLGTAAVRPAGPRGG